MRNGLMVLLVMLCSITSSAAQVSVSIGLPGVSIGINQSVYPELVPVPGYPVYYAPQVNSNYFFYDGMYWVYEQDNWYVSSWYNGPWELVGPEAVPLFVLRIPVRYYRQPPAYFQGWSPDAPPRWGEHWGEAWQQRRSGWDTWNHSSVPPLAPLPVYQRQYSGNRYPPAAQQQVLQSKNYRYQPQDTVAKQYYQAHGVQSAPVSSQRGAPAVARGQPTQKEGGATQRPAVVKAPAQEPTGKTQRPAVAKAPEQEPKAQPQRRAVVKAPAQEPMGETQRAAIVKAPPQEPKAQAQRHAIVKAPAQEPKAQTQRPAVVKAPAQEPKAQTQRPAVAVAHAQEPKAQTQRSAPPKASPQEPKGGQENREQSEQGGEHNK
jgi:hypothetical protein